jgi:hypothetical protein
MKTKLILVSVLLSLSCVGGLYSGPQSTGDSTRPEVRDLVHRMVQVAADRYRVGRLASADKILQACLEIEPGNAEACYYMRLVQASLKATKEHPKVGLWYPTIPPRPASK